VPTIQSAEQIQGLLERLTGREIAGIQVLGINSLKSLLPMPEAITGGVVTVAEIGVASWRVAPPATPLPSISSGLAASSGSNRPSRTASLQGRAAQWCGSSWPMDPALT
jgi:hypothetical protein